MIALANTADYLPAVRDEMIWLLRSSRSPLVRTPTEFAEQSIVMPEGEYEGENYRAARQPFAAHVLREFERTDVNRFIGLGCVQSGKSFAFLVIPICYHIAELKENTILAAPSIELAKKKWKKEVLPVFRASPALRELLPETGRGSKGGVPDTIYFRNGATLEFMSAGGGDETRSSSTARIVVVTEVDKMDEAGEVSREADPIKQLEARTAHFADRGRLYLECTVSIEDGRIWQEHLKGSGGEFLSPCVHCRSYVRIEREHFHGFEHDNVVDARREAFFCCPDCGEHLSDDDRETMQDGCVLVHRGQKVNKRGKIAGEFPKTLTSSVRWSAFDNRFWPTPFIAKWEWEAYRAKENDDIDQEDFEKRQCQFMFTKPYDPEDFNDFNLDPLVIRRRYGPTEWTEGVIPSEIALTGEDSTFYDKDLPMVTMGIDIGKSTCHWVLLAFLENRTIHMPAYGEFTAPSDLDESIEISLMNSLRLFRDEVIEPGFQLYGTTDRARPLAVWIDAGYQTEVIYAFCRETRTLLSEPMIAARYRPTFGRGKSQAQFSGRITPYAHPKVKDNTTREIGDNWFARINREQKCRANFFNADHWKLWVQRRLVTKLGEVGSMSFFRSSRRTGHKSDIHTRLAYQLTNEKLHREEKPGKGVVEEWVKRGQNHKLDAAAMAAAAGSRAGFTLVG